eukprot:GILJ01000512.1.p1 GENE.GILJ01000512.1~~GILJ01000512.1.p1  ORF type:complete len:492 (-),score=35.78 GILJ01000512.1:311-1786(-)
MNKLKLERAASTLPPALLPSVGACFPTAMLSATASCPSCIGCNSVSADFASLVNSPDASDVVFLVGPTQEKMFAHKLILTSRCSYFRRCFSSQWKEDDGVVRKPNMSVPVMASVLRFIYTNQLLCDEKDLMDVMYAAEEFGLDALKEQCGAALAKSLSPTSAFSLLECGHKLSVNCLFNCALAFVCQNATAILASESFSDLSSELLCELLEQDDLRLSELDVWRLVVKWGKAQLGLQNYNTVDLSSRQRKKLTLTIFPCLQHIRLFLIHRDEFFEIEESRLMPSDLCYDYLRFHLCPLRYKDNIKGRMRTVQLEASKVRVDSTVLTDLQTRKLESLLPTKPLGWSLLYRASSHGFSSETFHEKCDDIGPLVIVVRTTAGKICGAYTSAAFKSEADDYSHGLGFTFEFLGDGSIRRIDTTELARSVSNCGPLLLYVDQHREEGKTQSVYKPLWLFRLADNCHQNCESGCSNSHAGRRFMVSEYEVFKMDFGV